MRVLVGKRNSNRSFWTFALVSVFSYRDIKSTYVIVLFEKSPKEFQKFTEKCLHYFQQRSNTGLELELLQKYIFVPLDIFHKILQDRPIENELEAWLTFLSNDDPKKILELVQCYPEFQPMYEQIYAMCRNVEDVMGFFSEELRILDRNTTQLMIDEMEENIKKQKEEIAANEKQLAANAEQLAANEKQLAANAEQLAANAEQLAAHEAQLAAKDAEIAELKQQLAAKRIE